MNLNAMEIRAIILQVSRDLGRQIGKGLATAMANEIVKREGQKDPSPEQEEWERQKWLGDD
jgi:hypothetical protein